MLAYDFGPQHPLRPERLRRTVELLESFGVQCLDPGEGNCEDALRVHSTEYVRAVERISSGDMHDQGDFGFGSLDNPPFPGMYEASLAYLAGSVRAAEAVRDGAPLAFGIGGGLHHAHGSKASGFCIFNDASAAVNVLQDRFQRVAYVDIDVHHGDGVQWMFYDDPHVLTCSIHQDGRTLFPGTGGVDETGAAFTSINVPVAPNTTGDVWLWAFEEGIMPALQAFCPDAIVLQMGTDTHFLDPLARVQNTAQEWLEAVKRVKSLGFPIVALGGGGYEVTCVPRMWAAACLTLSGIAVPEDVPEPMASEWHMPRFFDDMVPSPRDQGRREAQAVLGRLRREVHPRVPRPR
jgi:acetoin utilization protein AcuC